MWYVTLLFPIKNNEVMTLLKCIGMCFTKNAMAPTRRKGYDYIFVCILIKVAFRVLWQCFLHNQYTKCISGHATFMFGSVVELYQKQNMPKMLTSRLFSCCETQVI